jgi:phospholipid-binding lipoprotein MlaA
MRIVKFPLALLSLLLAVAVAPVHARAQAVLPDAGAGEVQSAVMTADADQASNDPLEPLNRKVFAFNLFLDDYLLVPVAKGYRTVTPEVVRDRISNVLSTLEEPRTAINSLLQGNLRKTGDALTRFMVNATFGLFGLFDVAGEYSVTTTPEDFGQTLAVWGVPAGPYLMLPVLGPSSPRDAAGTATDGLLLDPMGLATSTADTEVIGYTKDALDILDFRSRNIESVAALRQSSVDFYARIRSLYWQMTQNGVQDNGADAAEVQVQQNRVDQAFDSYFAGETGEQK